MFAALVRKAERHTCKFNAQGLANTAWAFAMVDVSDALVFAAFAREVQRSVGKVQRAGSCQHGMGVYDCGSVGRAAVYSVDEFGGAARL